LFDKSRGAKRIMLNLRKSTMIVTSGTMICVASIIGAGALADPLAYGSTLQGAPPPFGSFSPAERITQDRAAIDERPERLLRQIVRYRTHLAPGSIVIDTPNTYLYYVLGGERAIRYGIGVGREGFTWSGVQPISRKAEWPDWIPPEEMLQRQPYLPRFMAGGPGNPLGARALYLGSTAYRIHGTNDPDTIGRQVSSGCIRLRNDDVADLYDRAKLGATVIVLPANRVSQAAHHPTKSEPPSVTMPAVAITPVRAFGLY
jgi:lipoprotein-anchoring transpeptidase ErfK/SrfK